jgi:FkbM family methyltransferase
MNPLSIKLRSIGRKLGLHRLVYRVRAAIKPNRRYEEPCRDALEHYVRLGDTVWDVGANIGVYTELFCKWVGPQGQVVAFEPNPNPIARIKDRLKDCPWLTTENVGLGSRAEQSVLIVDGDYTVSGHVHYDAEKDSMSKLALPIQMTTGDEVRERIGRSPNVVKSQPEASISITGIGRARRRVLPPVLSLLVHPDVMVVTLEQGLVANLRRPSWTAVHN